MTDQNLLKQDEWWLSDLARELKMPIATLHNWQRKGWVSSRKVAEANRWAIYADASELKRLVTLRSSGRGWPDPYPRHLITPKPSPQRSA